MKNLMIIALCCASQLVFAEDLRTKEGTVYKDVTILSANPARLMIVHAGGGCQVEYANLDSDTLSETQWEAIEEGLKVSSARTLRMEQLQRTAEELRVKQENFKEEQLDKGLILFEGHWMKPADRQELMANRALQRMEQERLSIQLEKEKAELRRAQYLAEQEKQRLVEYQKSRRSFSYYSYPTTRTIIGCSTPKLYNNSSHHHNNAYSRSSYRYCTQVGGISVSYRRGSSSLYGKTSGHSRH